MYGNISEDNFNISKKISLDELNCLFHDCNLALLMFSEELRTINSLLLDKEHDSEKNKKRKK
jgi:hypothetical protein